MVIKRLKQSFCILCLNGDNKKEKGKLHKKLKPLGVFLNKTLTNFFFQIKPQSLKNYQKKPYLDNCTGNVEFFVEISYIQYAKLKFYITNMLSFLL